MKRILIAVAVFALAASAGMAQSPLPYSNTTNFLGQAFANAGSTNTAGTIITRLVADDITMDYTGHVSRQMSIMTFSVANLNAVAVSARARVRFWDNDGTAGAPGTLLGAVSFNPISFAAGVSLFFSDFTAFNIILPADGTFWAGMTFDNVNPSGGFTGATQAQMDLLGQGIFNPPTAGSSADVAFITTAAGSFASNNPAGSTFNFGGNPVANFGWSFAVVPEPTTWALLGLGVCSALPAYRRWRAGKLAKDQAVSFYENKA